MVALFTSCWVPTFLLCLCCAGAAMLPLGPLGVERSDQLRKIAAAVAVTMTGIWTGRSIHGHGQEIDCSETGGRQPRSWFWLDRAWLLVRRTRGRTAFDTPATMPIGDTTSTLRPRTGSSTRNLARPSSDVRAGVVFGS